MTMPMRRLSIDRLRLQVQGIEKDAAHRLAELVAEGLAPGLVLPPGLSSLDSLEVEVGAKTGDKPDDLSRRIVDAIGRALAAEPSPAGGAGDLDTEGYVL